MTSDHRPDEEAGDARKLDVLQDDVERLRHDVIGDRIEGHEREVLVS